MNTVPEVLLEQLNGWIAQVARDLRLERATADDDDEQIYRVRMSPSGAISFYPGDGVEIAPVLATLGQLSSFRPQDMRGGNLDWAWPPAPVRFRILSGADARLKLGDRPFDSLALVGIEASRKLITAVLDWSDARVLMVVKTTGDPHMVRNLRDEADALRALDGRDVAPQLLAWEEIPVGTKGPMSIYETWLPGLPLGTHGTPEVSLENLEARLSALVDPKREVTLFQLREELIPEAMALSLPVGERDSLFGILDTITDQTPIAASRTHGDLKPSNVLVGPQGRLGFVDWEFSRARGLVVCDLLRFVLDSRYHSARHFSDFLDGATGEPIRRIRTGSLPGARLPLGQLLALQFCTHFCDRIRSFGDDPNPRMQTLRRLIDTNWPYAEV